MYSLERQALRKLKPGFGQRGFLGPIVHLGEAERPGSVRWGEGGRGHNVTSSVG